MWEFLDAKFHLTHGFHLILILLYAQILLHLVPLLYFCGRRIEAFLSFWSVTSLFAYSYAGEKVPWLTVHVVGPLILVAAIQIRDWKILHGLPSRRRTAVLTALLIIAVVYQVRNNYLLNQTNAAIPSERLVYNHTSPDMAEAMKIIERVELETGFGKQLPIFVQGEMAWPMHWYLRHRPNSVTATEESLDVTTRPLVMVDWSEARNENLNRNYYLRRMKVREWWVPPMLDIGAMTGIWRVLTPTESRTDANDAHIQYAKCILEWQKLWHYLAYREIWIDPFNPDWSNGANEFVFGIRKDLSSTYLNSNWLGLLPKRRDITIFP